MWFVLFSSIEPPAVGVFPFDPLGVSFFTNISSSLSPPYGLNFADESVRL